MHTIVVENRPSPTPVRCRVLVAGNILFLLVLIIQVLNLYSEKSCKVITSA